MFYNLPEQTFKGLPGFIADALPDDFGNALVNRYMAGKGILPRDITILDRLAYTGKRAMGALEFEPSSASQRSSRAPLDMAVLVEQARRALHGDLQKDAQDVLQQLLAVGTSAGGARAKAVIAINDDASQVIGGQFEVPAGFTHWLLKFDGVGKDTELGVSQGYGRIEYAYHLMADAAGVRMSECRLLEEGGRAHFMTRRFDRDANNKILFQSLCAMQHLCYRQKGVHDYEDYFRAITALQLGYPALEQAYIRMAFNVMGRNCDDHTKNFAFIMRPGGNWELAPAYDVIYAFNPKGEWTYQHLCGVGGKFDGHDRADLLAIAKKFNIKTPAVLLDRVRDAVRRWPDFAEQADVPADMTRLIADNLKIF